jgi:hypothetical protein
MLKVNNKFKGRLLIIKQRVLNNLGDPNNIIDRYQINSKTLQPLLKPRPKSRMPWECSVSSQANNNNYSCSNPTPLHKITGSKST